MLKKQNSILQKTLGVNVPYIWDENCCSYLGMSDRYIPSNKGSNEFDGMAVYELKQFYKQIGFKLEKIYLVMSINQGYLEELTFQKYIGVLDY